MAGVVQLSRVGAGHIRQSRQRGVATAYQVFDMSAICRRPPSEDPDNQSVTDYPSVAGSWPAFDTAPICRAA